MFKNKQAHRRETRFGGFSVFKLDFFDVLYYYKKSLKYYGDVSSLIPKAKEDGKMSIITKELVEKAIELSRPSAVTILNQEGATWGPRWVAGCVSAPGLEDLVYFGFGEKPIQNWDAKWGDPANFDEIAEKKLALVLREKASSSVIVATRPWCLQKEEFLYAGGVYDDEIAAAASGAKGRADEAISGIVVVNIKMLVFLETDLRIQEKRMQI